MWGQKDAVRGDFRAHAESLEEKRFLVIMAVGRKGCDSLGHLGAGLHAQGHTLEDVPAAHLTGRETG